MVVNEHFYEKNSFLEALEFALKLYFALDLSYCSNSNTLWTFVQKAVMRIDEPGDKNLVYGLLQVSTELWLFVTKMVRDRDGKMAFVCFFPCSAGTVLTPC